MLRGRLRLVSGSPVPGQKLAEAIDGVAFDDIREEQAEGAAGGRASATGTHSTALVRIYRHLLQPLRRVDRLWGAVAESRLLVR